MELERPAKSALARLLRDAGRPRPRSIGFGRERDEGKSSPAMVLIAEIGGLDAAAARAAIDAGASAVAFAIDADTASGLAGNTTSLPAAVTACGDAVAGLLFAAEAPVAVDLADQLTGTGVDFVVAAVQHAPASLLSGDALGRVPMIDASQPAVLIRAIGDMDVDALWVAPPRRRQNASGLTLYDLMHYKGVAELVKPPILVVAEQAIRPEDLQAMRDIGVDGVVVPLRRFASGASATAELAAFRVAIGKVKITRKTDRGGGDGGRAVFLPRVSPAAAQADDDDDSEDQPANSSCSS